MGKDWAGPFFPPSLIFWSSIDRFVFRFMLLFHSILTFMKDLYQSENQVFNPTRLLVLLHCWVGKEWAGPFFPPLHNAQWFCYLRILHLLRISFYFSESRRVPGCNSIADLSLKIVFWTHKFAVGTHWYWKQWVPGLISPKL